MTPDLDITRQSCLPFASGPKERFEHFHAENPEVYREFVRRARHAKNKGHHRFGAWMILGAMRWTYAMERSPTEQYKINNNYVAHYARLAMEQEPDLAGFFETRKLK